MKRHLELGVKGEGVAERYLRSVGYRLLEKNYRCSFGEIDLIAKDKKTLVFIEVKTRSDASYGYPEESIDRRKIQKLVRSAQFYMKENRLEDIETRFDVFSVMEHSGTEKAKIKYIKSAFSLDEIEQE